MSAIRPDIPSNPQLPASPAASQVRAAQASFFRAALAEVQAGGARPAPITEEPPAAHADVARPMRPGALLDIRV